MKSTMTGVVNRRKVIYLALVVVATLMIGTVCFSIVDKKVGTELGKYQAADLAHVTANVSLLVGSGLGRAEIEKFLTEEAERLGPHTYIHFSSRGGEFFRSHDAERLPKDLYDRVVKSRERAGTLLDPATKVVFAYSFSKDGKWVSIAPVQGEALDSISKTMMWIVLAMAAWALLLVGVTGFFFTGKPSEKAESTERKNEEAAAVKQSVETGVSGRSKVILTMILAAAVMMAAVGSMVFLQVAPQFEYFLASRGRLHTEELRSSSMVELLYEQRESLQKRLNEEFGRDKELMYVVITKRRKGSDGGAGGKPFEVFVSRFDRSGPPKDLDGLIDVHLNDPDSMIRGDGFLGFTSEVRTGSGEYSDQWGHVLVGFSTSQLQALKAWLLKSLILILVVAVAGFAGFVHFFFKRRESQRS